MNKISFGLIGFGKHSEKVWLPTLQKNQSIKLLGISSSKFDIENKFYQNTEIKLHSSHEELITDPKIDAVLISTENKLHAAQICLALKHNKHIICEKPLSYTKEDIQNILSFKSKDSIVCCSFMYRHHPQWTYLKNWFRENRDKPWIIEGKFQYTLNDPKNFRAQFPGGGPILDGACYLIDALEYLEIEEPTETKIISHKQNNLIHSANISMKFGDNQFANFFCSQEHINQQSFSIQTPNAEVILDSPFICPKGKKVNLQITSIVGKKKTDSIKFEFTDCYSRQLSTFIESINSRELITPLTDGVNNSLWLSEINT